MAARRSRSSQRNEPWDSSNPANWTVQKLRDELRVKFDIFVPLSMSKANLKGLYLETLGRRRESAPSSPRLTLTTDRNVDIPNTTASRRSTSRQSNSSSDSRPSVQQNSESLQELSSSAATSQPQQQSEQAHADRSTDPAPSQINARSQTTTNMAAPTAVMQGMVTTVQTLQQTVMSMQQTMLTMLADRNSATRPVQQNNLEAAYAAMESQGNRPAGNLSDPEVPSTSSPGQPSTLPGPPTRQGDLELDSVVNSLWTAAIAPSTRQTYTTGFNIYLRFLLLTGIVQTLCSSHVFPVSEDLLLRFVAHCFGVLHLSYATIKLYLCGIRFCCLEKNISHPSASELPRLHAILNGVKRMQVRKPITRYPVTFSVLKQVCEYLRKQPTDLMLETACTIAFFGFLRCGEFTVKSRFDPNSDLCVSDLTLSTDCALLTLKHSKTDPFRQGITIKLFTTGNSICPYQVCCKYLKHRLESHPAASEPLFISEQGQILTRSLFISKFRHVLECIGINSAMYNGHSFRIGAATTAAQVHMEDHMIKTLGRWSSDAYCRYIRTPVSKIQDAQKSLSQVT
ncbi:uncharacterized protein [Argopecten irradians]|uniref:uncharacterized protein n=1 Tax=Argopecten irradians TaxID=31199 RepID=UPI00371682AB